MTHSVCSNITVIDGVIVNLFVIIPSQYENAKNVIISEIMKMKQQILMLALEVRGRGWCSSLINVTKWDSVQWVEELVNQMWGMKFRGVTTTGVFWWGRLQGKFDRKLILWIRNDFIEIFGAKYNLFCSKPFSIYPLNEFYHQECIVFPT